MHVAIQELSVNPIGSPPSLRERATGSYLPKFVVFSQAETADRQHLVQLRPSAFKQPRLTNVTNRLHR